MEQTSAQAENLVVLPIKRIVCPIGSGMTFRGIAKGLKKFNIEVPLVGVKVGADYTKRFDKFMVKNFEYTIVKSELKYADKVKDSTFCGINLNKTYEAKCIPFLEKGDLLWIVGY